MSTAVDNRERQARAAGEEARRRILGLSEERGRVFLDQLSGREGADERAEELDREIAELERRAKIADDAAAEAAKQAEERERKREEAEIRDAREEYGELVGERRELVEAVETALDDLDAAVNRAQVAAVHHAGVAERAGLPGVGDFAGLVGGRVASRLVHITGGRYISHPIYETPLPESDRMCMTLSDLEAEEAEERRRRGEQADQLRRADELQTLSDRIASRRYELMRLHGVNNADAPPAKVAQLKPRIEEQLREEFPELRPREER